jgi:hypothetical protein
MQKSLTAPHVLLQGSASIIRKTLMQAQNPNFRVGKPNLGSKPLIHAPKYFNAGRQTLQQVGKP